MKFGIAQQADGSYVLRFEQAGIRCDVAITAQDMEVLSLEVAAAIGGQS